MFVKIFFVISINVNQFDKIENKIDSFFIVLNL